MQIHLSRRVLSAWRTLPAEVRQFVQSLRTNPRPPGVLQVPERPHEDEEFVAGFWVIWHVDTLGRETVVRVTTISE